MKVLLKKLNKNKKVKNNDLSIFDKQIIEKIFKFASIKHILNKIENDEYKILELLEEIIRDIKNYELELE